MQQQLEQLAVEEMDDSNLLDCYRIALDFGMPAALKAYEKLAVEPVHKSTDSTSSFDNLSD
jgi:hypothetical protein